MKNKCYIEPLLLYGEGKYALSAIKEVAGTNTFLSMDEKIKLCQSKETYQQCMTKEYIKKGLETCGCTPFTLRNFTKKACFS